MCPYPKHTRSQNFVSEASKPSAGARISKGSLGPLKFQYIKYGLTFDRIVLLFTLTLALCRLDKASVGWLLIKLFRYLFYDIQRVVLNIVFVSNGVMCPAMTLSQIPQSLFKTITIAKHYAILQVENIEEKIYQISN